MSKTKHIVANLSDTQRVSLKKGDSSITILKEFRRNSNDGWITAKGIEIPKDYINTLTQYLNELAV